MKADSVIFKALNRVTARDVATAKATVQDGVGSRDFFMSLMTPKLEDDVQLDKEVTDDELYVEIRAWMEQHDFSVPDRDSPKSLDDLMRLFLDFGKQQHLPILATPIPIPQPYLTRDDFFPKTHDLREFAMAIQSAIDITNKPETQAYFMSSQDMYRRLAESIIDIVPKYTDMMRQSQLPIDAYKPQLLFFMQEMERSAQYIGKMFADSIMKMSELQLRPLVPIEPLARQMDVLATFGRALNTNADIQSRLFSVHPEHLGRFSVLSSTDWTLFGTQLKELASSYSDHITSLDPQTIDAPSTDLSILVESPIQEMMAIADYAEVISLDPTHIEYVVERQARRAEFSLENEDTLRGLLNRLDPSLTRMYDGARQALASDNIDRVRHFAVSFRELLTQVIHILAPDTVVKSWSTDASHFNAGRATRRARLLYICRNINHPPFDAFVSKDIEALLALMDLYQAGTHSVEPPFSSDEALALKIRLEHSLSFVLHISSRNQS